MVLEAAYFIPFSPSARELEGYLKKVKGEGVAALRVVPCDGERPFFSVSPSFFPVPRSPYHVTGQYNAGWLLCQPQGVLPTEVASTDTVLCG